MEILVPILIIGFIIFIVAVPAVLLFFRAVESRKRYTCPQCGERIRVELMKASHCNVCGAPLELKNGGY